MKLAPHTLDQSTIALWRLARAVGIMPAYIDNDGKHVRAAPETLLTVIQSWGVDISSIEDAPGALQQLRAQQATATLDPAYVLWQPSTARKRRPHHKQPSQQQTPPNISC